MAEALGGQPNRKTIQYRLYLIDVICLLDSYSRTSQAVRCPTGSTRSKQLDHLRLFPSLVDVCQDAKTETEERASLDSGPRPAVSERKSSMTPDGNVSYGVHIVGLITSCIILTTF